MLALSVSFIAGRAGFYRPLLKHPYSTAPTFGDLFAVFSAYFLFYGLLFPLAIYLGFSWKAGAWLGSSLQIPEDTQILINCISLWVAAVFMWGFCRLFKPAALKSILRSEKIHTYAEWLANLALGACTWLISFPVVIVFNQTLALFLEHFFKPEKVDQVAVKVLKMSLSHPYLLAFYLIAIVCIVPLIEEFMFRGILQRWLCAKVGPWFAILGASFFFALLHYAGSQGLYNLELLPSLFVLSCYLGYLYERQQSLWAPIGLHATFNFVSAVTLVINEMKQ